MKKIQEMVLPATRMVIDKWRFLDSICDRQPIAIINYIYIYIYT